VGEVEAGAAGGGGDAGGVGAMVAGGLLRLGLVGGLAGGCFVQGEVFEHGGPAGLDGVAGGVEELEAGLVGAGALGARGRGAGCGARWRPPSWTMTWWRRQSRARPSMSVGPPWDHGVVWWASRCVVW